MPNELHEPAAMPCPACDFGPFTRNAYWTGKLMLARDFVDEQRYVIEKLRHHNQQLHGWGVVCGLKVVPHLSPACRDRFVCVEPGTAVDCCGHDIIVREKDCLDLFADPAVKALREKNDTNPHTLQLCIKYRECESEPIPVLYDECGCDDNKCAPNRVLESYELHVLVDPALATPPPAPPAQCGELWETSLEGCAHCDQPDCLILATIKDYKIGNQIVDALPDPLPPEGAVVIDNLSDRRLLPSTQLIKEVIDCILTQGTGGGGQGPQGPKGDPGPVGPPGPAGPQGPTGPGLEEGLTQIESVSWKHNAHVALNTFKRVQFTGNHHQTDDRALVFGFSNEVTIVDATDPELRRPDAHRVLEVLIRHPAADVPELVCRCSLIGHVLPVSATQDPNMFQEVAGNASRSWGFVFTKNGLALATRMREIFVRLRGDFVLDATGRAVDAEFARATFDTGDRPAGSKFGIQGGLFESWFWIDEAGATGRVNLNTASRDELEALPGIGPATAERIMSLRRSRRFRDLEDLRSRLRITESEWEAIKDLITVEN